MQLSKGEDLVYSELKRNGFAAFKAKDIRLLLNVSSTKAYNLIKSLKNKKIIKKINGFFVFYDTNEFIVSTLIHYPAYISFWTALNYYGWSDQNPKKIFLATTKYTKEFDSFKYITIDKKKFFGYVNIGGIVIADKEKAIIDSLFLPRYSGGINEIKKCVESALKELDIKKIISYAIKLKSKAVARRLGFILEELGYKKINKLKKHIGEGYVLFDPTLKKKNKYNKKWLLDVNI